MKTNLLIIIFILINFVVFAQKKSYYMFLDSKTGKAAEIEKNDKIRFSTNNIDFVGKIDSISEDSIFLAYNSFAIDDIKNLEHINDQKGKKYFRKSLFSISGGLVTGILSVLLLFIFIIVALTSSIFTSIWGFTLIYIGLLLFSLFSTFLLIAGIFFLILGVYFLFKWEKVKILKY